MGTRRGYGNVGAAHVQTVQNIINQLGTGFVPRQDPLEELSREIEKCSRKIWACVGDRDENPAKKPRKEENEDQVENTSAPEEQKQSLAVEVKKEHSVQSRGELIFTLNAMKYREIQLQCKDYGLAATGNKEALRDRLLSYLLQFREADAADTDENHPEGGAAPSEGITNEQGSSKTDVTMQDERKETETMIEKEEETYMVVDTQEFSSNADKKETPADAKAFKEAEPARVSYASENNMEVDPVDLNEGTDKELMEVEGPAVKSSPGKVHDGVIKAVGVEKQAVSKSPLRAFVKDAVNHMTDSSQKAKLISQISTPGDHLSPPPSDFTTSTASSKISGTKVREIVSKLSSHSGQSSSALSGKLQASKDARMARLAEMRGKSQLSKTMTSTNTPSSNATTSSLVSNKLAPSNTKMNLAAQMREKALRKENGRATRVQPINGASSMKRPFALKSAIVTDPLGTTLKSATALGSSMKTYSVKKKSKSPPRPSQTYEISDREDSDSDDSEAENGKRKKELPKWVLKENLRPSLHAQYIGKTVDPDEIFGEVHTCDLEAIFGNQLKAKYRSRTSSGNWSKDRVTAAEKLVYKRAMGFDET